MMELVLVMFYTLFWIVGVFRKSLLLSIVNFAVTVAFFHETQDAVLTAVMLLGLIAQILLTLRAE
ncbi:MAG: hypothetical protein QW512_04040 [Thermofilaceae archaeon]